MHASPRILPSRGIRRAASGTSHFVLDPARPITIAVDTEFKDVHTLTIQVAARVEPGTLAIQVYRSRAIPRPPRRFSAGPFLTPERYGPFFDRALVRPPRAIAADLSPAHILGDLLAIRGLTPIPRHRGLDLIQGLLPSEPAVPPNLTWNSRSRRWNVPTLDLYLVGHFLAADFYRLFGREFIDPLLAKPDRGRRRVEVQARRLITFREQGGHLHQRDPVVEYATTGDGSLFAIRVVMRDTMLPFGVGSLDALSRTFLGLSKADVLTEEDKRNMLRTFREQTRDAYGYSIVDVVNTLLLYEKMQEKDREIYRSFGFAEGEIPPFRPTLGGRVTTFLLQTAWTAASGSTTLSTIGKLRTLMQGGGIGLFDRHPEASRYGKQTGEVHGGLIFSRSPTKLWHEAPGQFRDVDMVGSYNRVISGMGVYWGRPVVLEPGDMPLDLDAAAALAQVHADPDGWIIRVTGEISAAPNALILSTEGALTSRNYRARKARRRAGDQGRGHTSDRGLSKTRLYSAVIESGIVTHATWQVIQALPPALRAEYGRLTADTIILYPRILAARSAAEYDELVARRGTEGLPWSSELDLDRMRILTAEAVDAAYASLRYPIGSFASRVGEFRRQARRESGRGSGLDLAWKQHGNTMYGALACPHFACNNFVAANIITAHVRAEVFAMVQALNGFQVVTDGCPYRRDQIPACTYAECLERFPDYPIRRADEASGIPFLDQATIPDGDVAFNHWYREHVRRFFEREDAGFDTLVATHDLEHKTTGTPPTPSFDAIAVDGCANHMKLRRGDEDVWQVGEFKARAFGKEGKLKVQGWILETYPTDRLIAFPPIAKKKVLLKHDAASRECRAALAAGIPAVVHPLGLEHRTVANYKAIKPSAFVFQNPRQYQAILKQIRRFEHTTGCGLESLALRRSYKARKAGSIADIAEAVYAAIREGRLDLVKVLNMNRKSHLAELYRKRLRTIARKKSATREALRARIDLRNVDAAALLTGRIETADGQPWRSDEPTAAGDADS